MLRQAYITTKKRAFLFFVVILPQRTDLNPEADRIEENRETVFLNSQAWRSIL